MTCQLKTSLFCPECARIVSESECELFGPMDSVEKGPELVHGPCVIRVIRVADGQQAEGEA